MKMIDVSLTEIKQALIFLALLILMIIAVYAFFFFLAHPLIYERDYYKKIGIPGSKRYDYVIAAKGNPIAEEDTDEDIFLYYDGLKLVIGKYVDTKKPCCLDIAIVTGKQYRFGIRRIGVGTDREIVESVYKNITKIVDLPENKFGAIDNEVWVRFEFDENNKVSKILFYYGP